MNNIWTLLKIDFLKDFKVFDMDLKGKNKFKNLLLIGLLFFCLLPLYISFIAGIWFGYDLISLAGGDLFYLQIGMVMSQMIILIFSISKILNSFYFDTDIDMLIPLPLKSYEILASKFLSIGLREYGKVLLFYLPFLFIYGYKTGGGILYFIYAILNIIVTPIFPLTLVAIIVMIIMKYTNIGKKKDLVRGIGMTILVFGIIFLQLFIQKNVGDMDNTKEIIKLISNSIDSMTVIFSKIFPISYFSSKGLLEYKNLSGLINIILSFSINIIMFSLMLYTGEKVYLDGFLSGGLTRESSKKSKDKSLKYRQSKPYIAICKKELRVLFRTPIYFLNSIMGSLLIPIIFLVSFSFEGSGLGGLQELYRGNKILGVMIFVAIGLFLNVSGVSSTTFSREGKSFWMQKQLPISGEEQAKGRLLVGIVIHLAVSIVLAIVSKVALKMGNIEMVIIIVYNVLLSIPLIAISIMIDMKKPKLTWSSPEEAMKQNMNVLKVMAITLLYILVLGGISILLYNIANPMIIYIVMGVIGLIFSLVSYRKLIFVIDREMNK